MYFFEAMQVVYNLLGLGSGLRGHRVCWQAKVGLVFGRWGLGAEDDRRLFGLWSLKNIGWINLIALGRFFLIVKALLWRNHIVLIDVVVIDLISVHEIKFDLRGLEW